MIATPTVLILGAGASTHCGYPLGRDLVAQLCQSKGTKALDGLPKGWSAERVTSLLTKLSRSDPMSIDAFLESHRDDDALGKYLIAHQLKRCEELDRLFPPHDAGWYRYLFNRMLVNGEPRFRDNALSIVTFNYDRSLEAYLHNRLQACFDMSDKEAFEVLKELPLLHVHGLLGELPAHPYRAETTADELLEISRKIQIIHEFADQESDFCNDMFRQAHAKLDDAERIYFLGFGFHQDNVRRFRFFSPEATANKTIKATAQGYGPLDLAALKTSLVPLGFPADAFRSVLCSEFFHSVAGLD